jgi:tetratricopeptide (TPR) repeat protein
MTVTSTTDADDEQQPYVGLRPFRPQDGQRFFGRSDDTAKVGVLWQANRVTVLCGPSGVGKTSLVQAGVLAHVNPRQADVLPVGRPYRISAFPAAALPEHNPYTLALLSSWSPGEIATRLSGLTVRDYLSERRGRTDSYGDPLPVFAVIDQAEKLFLDLGRHESRHQDRLESYRQEFVGELAEALDSQPGLRLLVSIRADSLDDLARYDEMLGNPAVYSLQPLTTPAGIEAVRRPVEQAGYSMTAGVPEELIGNLRNREPSAATAGSADSRANHGIEPALLQAVCAGFWAALPRPVTVIDFDLLRRYGDTMRLLASFCARAVTAVAEEHEMPAAELRSWLRRTFTSEHGAPTMANEGPDKTAGMPNTVVRALTDWHVLKAVRQGGLRRYQLQDDCLAGPIRRVGQTFSGGITPVVPSSATDHLRVAEGALADGDLDLAERQARAVARGTRGADLRLRAEAESLLGNIEHARSHLDEAEASYSRAAALFETLQDTSAVARLLAAIGQTLLARGRVAEAVEKLSAAIGRLPNDLTVQTELGRALWQQGQQTAAVAVLTGVLTADGHARNALRARGEILAELGQAEKALRDLDRVRQPRWPTVLAARALALATLRRPSAADEEISAALKVAPHNGPVLLYAARVSALGGQQGNAAELARRAETADEPALMPHQLKEARELQRLGQSGPGREPDPAV